MSKKDFRNPYHIAKSREDARTGPLREIWYRFFDPILNYNNIFEGKEGKMLFFDLVFGDREIWTGRTKRKVDIYGQQTNISNTILDGRDVTNKVRKDERLWIRQDPTQMFTDVETEDGRVFRMSNKQFSEFERYIAREQ